MKFVILSTWIALSHGQALPDKISPTQLQNVHKVSGIDKSVAFRCGMFFPDPKDDNALPVAPLLLLNATWAAPECSTDPTFGQDRFSKFCDSIVKPLSERLVLADKSLYRPHAARGDSIGDDMCGVLKNKVKAPFVGPKSKKFPNGIKFGMYTNQCGETRWHDTGFRHWEKICCDNGKYIKCPF